MTTLSPFIVQAPISMSGFDAVTIGFFVILGFSGLVVLLGLLSMAFRNVPIWIYTNWAHVTGILSGAYLYWKGFGWMPAVGAAAGGIVIGMMWNGLIDRQMRNKSGVLGRIQARLLKHASK
ncbi:MAG: hypothetical protein M5R36_14855 [Deltaproteobacteria bacterium]|nr:hypothetical protein [Deltaproteobacteria bacterium]